MAGDHHKSGDKKRKFDNARQQFGSRSKKKELGRASWGREKGDKRARNNAENEKRRQAEEARAQDNRDDGDSVKRRKVEGGGSKHDTNKPSVLPAPFTAEEIAAESRRPKAKVAVLIGYSGTGYRGMQINTTERTIEGDLFTAFVHAGAISKANANDPKKSGLVRCARTDKGVHAAGNMVSLKLIVEDSDIVEKINSHLSPQIRVWGIQKTVGSFSCYQACDSRYYEYLIPSHAFLPPNPNTFLGKTLVDVAEEVGELAAFKERQKEVEGFWEETEEKYIKPILNTIEDDRLKELILKALYEVEEDAEAEEQVEASGGMGEEVAGQKGASAAADRPSATEVEAAVGQGTMPTTNDAEKASEPAPTEVPAAEATEDTIPSTADLTNPTSATQADQPQADSSTSDLPSSRLPSDLRRKLETTTKALRAAYNTAKRNHRIPPARLDRIQSALDQFIGTQNYHNYTINKTPRDPSAKRLIKSFKLDREPKIINGTEWLSLRVHGQSFMMHQIRKMVSAAALVVRCGAPASRIKETLTADASVSIPKAPGLGLLLERPVFESYNKNTAEKFERAPLTFDKYEKEMAEFKQREIYERIFREEEQGGAFGTFFGHVDGFREGYFLWVTAKGVEAATRDIARVERDKRVESKPTGANAGVLGKRKDHGGDETGESKRKDSPPKRVGGVDSEDEEDDEEHGRADMDG